MSDRSNHRGATRPTTRPRLSLASATADPTLPARTPAGPQRPESTAWEALQAAESAESETDRFLDEYLAYLQADDAAVVALTAAKLHEAMERLFRAAAAVPPESTVSVSSTAGEYATAGNLPLSAARALLRAVSGGCRPRGGCRTGRRRRTGARRGWPIRSGAP
jgi:hypothetical protein